MNEIILPERISSYEDILELRKDILSRYKSLKKSVLSTFQFYRAQQTFIHFQNDVQDFLSLLEDISDGVPKDNLDSLDNIQAKIFKHENIQTEFGARKCEMDALEQLGLKMIKENHEDSDEIMELTCIMKREWEKFRSSLDDHIEVLRLKKQYIEYLRNFDKLDAWIDKKMFFLEQKIFFTNLGDIENYVHTINVLDKKVARMDIEVEEMKRTSDFFIKDDYSESYNVSQRKEKLIENWATLRDIVSSRKLQLSEFMRVYKLKCKIDQFMRWMDLKYEYFSDYIEEYTAELKTLLKQQDGMEKILTNMESKLDDIIEEHDELEPVYKAYCVDGLIIGKRVLLQKWLELKIKAKERGRNLRNLCRCNAYLEEVIELIEWMNGYYNIIATQRIAPKTDDPEMTLQICQIYRDVFDMRKTALEQAPKVGEQISAIFPERSDEIAELIEDVETGRQDITELIEEQESLYQSRLEFRKLNRKYDEMENWLKQKEAFLVLDEDVLNCFDSVQELIEEHKEFEIVFDNEAKRITFLVGEEPEVEKLTEIQDSVINIRRASITSTYETIKAKSDKRLQHLLEALKVQIFYADCDDIDRWINERLKIVTNESFIDPSCISGCIASNNLIVNELVDYTKIVYGLVVRERRLKNEKHFAAETVRKRVQGILDCWESLNHKTLDRISKLETMHELRTFLLATTALELQLKEYQERLDHQYIFHDGEISNILKVELNLETLERDVRVSHRQMHNIKLKGMYLIKNGFSSARTVMNRIRKLSKTRWTLTDIIEKKQQVISDARKESELFMDIGEQMKWINQKIYSLSVFQTELGLLDVQHLTSRYKTKKGEIIAREKEIYALRNIGKRMIAKNHYDKDEILKNLTICLKAWNYLKKKNRQYQLNLEEANRIYNYFAEAELHDAIMKEKHFVLSNKDYGTNEDSSTALLRRHEVLIDDLKAFGRKIEELKKQADICRQTELKVTITDERETVVAVENYTSRNPKELTVMVGDCLTLVNPSHEIWCKVEKDGHQGYVPKKCLSKIKPREKNSICPILSRQIELEKQYNELIELTEIRRKKLVDTVTAFSLIRESSEISSWIKVKGAYVLEGDIGESVEAVEIMQKKFNDFQSDLAEMKIKLIGMLTKTEKLLPLLEDELRQMVSNNTEDMKFKMQQLQEISRNRDLQLSSAHDLQRFYRDLDETEDWIQEKDKKLDNTDTGDSLKTVRTLLRKHKGLENELRVLLYRIKELEKTADRLSHKYPENAEQINSKLEIIHEMWSELSMKEMNRKYDLTDYFELYKFCANYDHIKAWMDRMIADLNSIICTQEFHSAEILVINFEGIVSEIEKFKPNIEVLQEYGETLINYNQKVDNDVQVKLDMLNQYCELLEQLKNSKYELVQQNLVINTFLRQCENLEYWLTDKEALLNTSDDNDKLITMHKKMEESLNKKEIEFIVMEQDMRKLLYSGYDDIERVLKRTTKISARWKNLRACHSKKRLQLKETQTLQQFSLEADEIEYWIDEKLQQATQENYRDTVNIKSKLLKHQAFEAEIESNTRRVMEVLGNGRHLIYNEESEKLKQAVRERLGNISRQWDYLQEKTKEKSEKLKEVSKQYDHIMGIKYINFWMGDIETLLINQDIGKGLNAVKNLLGQHKVIEEDIAAHWIKIKDLEKEADKIFTSDSIFDIVSIKEEHENMVLRYRRIEELASQRKARLKEKDALSQFFEVIADKEAWMKETALRIDEKNQPKFKCDKTQPTFRFQT
ncbi:spectrin alpha chain-like [Harmonia axyridis]|uniref:spectrin alpha chain-like n=1 Tax=Harmonia axyridis TaxID=115357 RepID=UPI001E277B0B|nr:spectrin alpha chain-like [Harmonia axyridis]